MAPVAQPLQWVIRDVCEVRVAMAARIDDATLLNDAGLVVEDGDPMLCGMCNCRLGKSQQEHQTQMRCSGGWVSGWV